MTKKKPTGRRKKVEDSYYCEACKKKFKSKKAYENHLKSKAHKKKVAALLAKSKLKEEMKEDSESQAPSVVVTTTYDDQTVCLFSNHKSESIEE